MTQDELKQMVAQAAVDHILPNLTPTSVIGIGTGSTANYFIDLLAPHKHRFQATVASSNASAARLRQHAIKVPDLNEVEQVDYYIDGTDEAIPGLSLIKGGGAALTQEKIVAAVAKRFICIADESKWVKQLGAFPLPVEVIPMARNHVARQLTQLGGRAVYRQGTVTDNGCHILDVYDLVMSDPKSLEHAINQIAGVVSNGLFAERGADVLLLGSETGVRTILTDSPFDA